MSTVRVSVTMDARLVADVRRLVGPRRVSSFINDVVAQRLQQERLRALLAEMEAEHGPIDRVEWERARSELLR